MENKHETLILINKPILYLNHQQDDLNSALGLKNLFLLNII